jgi:hypothetical protein
MSSGLRIYCRLDIGRAAVGYVWIRLGHIGKAALELITTKLAGHNAASDPTLGVELQQECLSAAAYICCRPEDAEVGHMPPNI